MNGDVTDPVVEDFKKEVRSFHKQSIADQRTHILHVFLIAGALATFSLPFYMSDQVTPYQRASVGLGIAAFLLCIAVGVWQMGAILTDELARLQLMQKTLDAKTRDEAEQAFREYSERAKPTKKSLIGLLIYILFEAGCVALLAALILGA